MVANGSLTSEVKCLEPAQDFLLVEIHEPGKTAGGIDLPPGYQDGPPKGSVVKVGPGYLKPDGERSKVESKIGDVVYLSFTHRPAELQLDNRKYCLVRDDAIIARMVRT